MAELRIGLGIDVHRLVRGRPCILGGIAIQSDRGPLGHSDGDAVLHAACDAVLGAAGLDDLGTLFSDRDDANRGRSSASFCAEVLAQVRAAGFAVVSLDVVVECERPILAPYRAAMRARIGELFGIAAAAVNLKGKSGEGLDDPVGRGDALRATAVALLRR
jgi:2-C-methyl-D-erythritol 2,4-cyclodiphosphate synthase